MQSWWWASHMAQFQMDTLSNKLFSRSDSKGVWKVWGCCCTISSFNVWDTRLLLGGGLVRNEALQWLSSTRRAIPLAWACNYILCHSKCQEGWFSICHSCTDHQWKTSHLQLFLQTLDPAELPHSYAKSRTSYHRWQSRWWTPRHAHPTCGLEDQTNILHMVTTHCQPQGVTSCCWMTKCINKSFEMIEWWWQTH